MVKSQSEHTLSPLKTLVVGVQSIKSSDFKVAVTFCSSARLATLPLIFKMGFINTVHVEPTSTDSSFRWNLQSNQYSSDLRLNSPSCANSPWTIMTLMLLSLAAYGIKILPSSLAAMNLFSTQSPVLLPLQTCLLSSRIVAMWPAEVDLWINDRLPFLTTALALRPLPTNSMMKSPTRSLSSGNSNSSFRLQFAGALNSNYRTIVLSSPSKSMLVLKGCIVLRQQVKVLNSNTLMCTVETFLISSHNCTSSSILNLSLFSGKKVKLTSSQMFLNQSAVIGLLSFRSFKPVVLRQILTLSSI